MDHRDIRQNTSPFFKQYAQLIYSNEIPHDVERQAILRHQSQVQARIALIDAAVKAPYEQFGHLIAEKSILMREYDACRLITSPIRRVPVDVLIEIFKLLDYTGKPDPLLSAPLLLCHVCQTWRNTAIDTPWFWKKLGIFVPHVDRKKLEHAIGNVDSPETHVRIIVANAKKMYDNAENVADFWIPKAKEVPLELKVGLNFAVPREPFVLENSLTFARALVKNILQCSRQSLHTLELYATDMDSVLHNLFPYTPQFRTLSLLRLMSSQRYDTWPPNGLPQWKRPGVHGFTIFQGAENLRRMICQSDGVRPILVPSSSGKRESEKRR